MREEHADFQGTAHYRIQHKLGAGGMGVVYLAQDTRQGIPVALKTLRRMNPQALYHFKNEFRALADLRHPNLIQLYELVNENGLWFFTMEFLPGAQDFMEYIRGQAAANASTIANEGSTANVAATIADGSLRLRSHSAVTVAEGSIPDTRDGQTQRDLEVAYPDTPALAIFDLPKLREAFRQLALGVSALHSLGKVHRDIKPSNVMVLEAGNGEWGIGNGEKPQKAEGQSSSSIPHSPFPIPRVVLMDFGLVTHSSAAHQSGTLSSLVGTPLYMAPEQASAAVVGPAADWYSVGVMLYEALTGRTPFVGSLLQIILQKSEERPQPPGALVPGLPGDLEKLCMDLLEIDPKDRPSGREVLRRLGATSAEIPTVVTSSPFVGRKEELKQLKQAFIESRTGHAVALFVQGASGLGKSALLRHFLEEMEQKHEALVLSGRCYEQEAVPYKAFDEIVDSLSRLFLQREADLPHLLPDEAVLVGRLFPVLQRIPYLAKTVEPKFSSLQELRSRAFVALRDIFRRLGQERPLILFIDDLQWADHDSVVLLRELLHPADPPAMLLLASVRTSRHTTSLTSLASLNAISQASLKTAEDLSEQLPTSLASLAARRLLLKPLPPQDAQALAKALATDRAGAEIDAIIEEAGGHPLFIDELLRRRQRGVVKLDEALWERVLALEEPSRRIVELVALAGAPLPQRLIAESAYLPLPEFMRRVSALRHAHLARTLGNSEDDLIEPYHDRVRESVCAHLSKGSTTYHATRLAEVLEADGFAEKAPDFLMRLFETAGLFARAAELAEKAAARASEALAFDRAAEFIRAALRMGSHTIDGLYRLRVSLGEALANAGRGAEAADAFLDATHGQPSEERLELKHKAAKHLLGSGYVPRGIDLLRSVLTELGEQIPPTPQDALDGYYQNREALEARGFAFTPRSENEIPRRQLILLDVFSSVSLSLSFVDNVRGAYFQTNSLRMALEIGEPRRIARSMMIEAIYVGQEGGEHMATAHRLYQDAQRILPNPDPYMAAFTVFVGGFLAHYEGRFRDAAKHMKDAEAQFKQLTGTAWELSTARLHRLRATDYQGYWDELRPLYDEYMHDALRRDDRFAEQSLRRWFNILWLANDQPDKAGEDLDKNPWTPPASGYHLQHFLEVRARLELALYRGTASQTAGWVRSALDDAAGSFLFRIQIARAISDWMRGRLALCDAVAKGSAEKFIVEAEEMASRLYREEINYGSIWAMLLQAAALTHRRRKEEALQLLHKTIKYSASQDFPLCAAIARRRQGELLGGEEGMRLIALAEQWMKSQEILNPAKMSEIFAPGFLV